MRVRTVLALAGMTALLAVPFASATGGPVASATGGIHWTIPLPNQFGVEVVNQPLSFVAQKYADGSVTGNFVYHQIVEGESFNFHVDVTDNSEPGSSPGAGPDTYTIRVWDNTSGDYYKLPGFPTQTRIDGGNIQVRP